MWQKLIKWIASKGLDMAEPYLVSLLDKDKAQLIAILNQADSRVIASQIIDAIKKELGGVK